MKLQPVRGTRDFYPEDMLLRNWLFSAWRAISTLYNFKEYDAPILEHEELYTRKAGEEITSQLYNFTDKGDRKVALRPEMTPSLARMVLAGGRELVQPIKWFSIPQCWRYERTTRGRKREHYQWNVDVFGIETVHAEAELMSMLVDFFTAVGLTSQDLEFRVSNRKLLQVAIESIGIAEDRFNDVCIVFDKVDKLDKDTLLQEFSQIGVSEPQAEQLLRIAEMDTLEQLVQAFGSESEAIQELQQLFDLAEDYGYGEWLSLDPSIVRGLSYYTGTVFEVFDRERSLRAICGGGRYNHLLSTFGGKDIPACGFGFGDVVILELLKDKDLLPNTKLQVHLLVGTYDAESTGYAIDIAGQVRMNGLSVECISEPKKAKWIFRHADRIGAHWVCFVGPDERKEGIVTLKHMASGEEVSCTPPEIVQHVLGEQS